MKNLLMRRWWMPAFTAGTMTFMIGCEEEVAAGRDTAKNEPVVAAVAVTNSPPAVAVTTNLPAPLPASTIAPRQLSPGVTEVVKLMQAGVEEQVILAYIENSAMDYKLTSDEIVYLTDLGLGSELLAAMLKKTDSLEARAAELAHTVPTATETVSAPVADTTQAVAAAPEPVATNVAPVAAAPVTVVTGTAPVVVPAPAQQVVVAAAPQQVNYFYEALSPYGTWVEVDNYGWCWQPTVAVVNVSWRPYADRGRWLYTDNGWYWQSDYSWGWAPFHYGRWHRHARIGWVWTPDTTWGPAWVTWRYSSDYCGWAPLPPGAHVDVGFGFRYRGSRVSLNFDFGLDEHCYTFIPSSRFCDRTPWNHCVTGPNITHVYRRTTVINNYTIINNNTIINNGIDHTEVAKLTRSEIRPVAIRDMNPREAGTLVRPDRLARDGKSLAVYRPNLPPQAAQPPKHVTRREISSMPSRVAAATPSTSSLIHPRGEISKPGNRPAPITTPGAPKYNQQPRPLPSISRPGELTTTRPSTTPPKSSATISPSRPTTVVPATPSRPVVRPSDGGGSTLANTPRPLGNALQQRPLAQPSRSQLEQRPLTRPNTPSLSTPTPVQVQPRTITPTPRVQTYPVQPSIRQEPRRMEVQPRVNTVQPPKYSRPPQQTYSAPRSSANFESRGNSAPQVQSRPTYSAPQRSAPAPQPQRSAPAPAPAPKQSGGNSGPSTRPSR